MSHLETSRCIGNRSINMTEACIIIFVICSGLYAAKAIDSDDRTDRFTNVVIALLWALNTGLMIGRL